MLRAKGNFPTTLARSRSTFLLVISRVFLCYGFLRSKHPFQLFPAFFLSSVLPLHTHPIPAFFPIPVFLIPTFQTGPYWSFVHGNKVDQIHRNTVQTYENGGNLTSNRTSFLYENRGNSPRYLYQRRAIVSSKNKKCIILVTRWLRNCITVVSIYSSFPMFQTSISIHILCFPILYFPPAVLSYLCVSPIPTFLKSCVSNEPLGPLS